MSRYAFNLLVMVIIGLITLLVGVGAAKFGLPVSLEQSMVAAFFASVVTWILLEPAVFQKLKYICNELDWADESVRLYHAVPVKYRQSFWILFAFINVAFLFNTINFMWGNEDWGAVRFAVDHNESLSAGSFSAYWLQELLFDGKILPVINNLWCFAGLSLAGVLLAVYWNLPQRATPIVFTGLLFAVTPFTLAVLYFAKTSLGVLFAPALVLIALLIADKKQNSEISSYLANLCSVLLFLIALGTYMPVINFAAVAILGQIFLKTVYADIKFRDAANRTVQGVVNLAAALMLYVLILYLLNDANHLDEVHAAALNLALPLERLPLVLKYAALQFALPLPFMDWVYKAVYGVLLALALFTLIFKAPSVKASVRGLILIPFLVIASVLALAFVAEPHVHFTRMSFFGLTFFYALMFVLIIRLDGKNISRVAYILAGLLIFMNFVRVAYAEKVWKFGWDAETKLAERIITRMEKMPEFNIDRRYKLLQIGEKSLRAKYYIKTPFEVPVGELLAKAYYPEGHAKEAYNFFYQTDFLEGDAEVEAVNEPVIRDYLLTKARAWPAKESLFIYGNYIVLILDDEALAKVQQQL